MSEAVSRRGRWAAVGVAVALAAGAVSMWPAGVFSLAAVSGAQQQGALPTATAAVRRQDITAVTPVNATLGYAGAYAVRGPNDGTLTWLPSVGQLISQGQALYRIDNGIPVVLLYGSVPAWRALDEGEIGADVSQLNHDLVALGDADGADISALGWDYFSWQTQVGVERLQSALGVGASAASLPLGRVVFESAAIRVSGVPGSLGAPADGTVLTATSAQQVVMIALSTSQESEVAVGDPVTVTLPDGAAALGTVSAVGAVASGAAGDATIPVTVTLTRPSAAGTLDQAPVTVDITTATVKNALAVPVTALVARSPGGYVVEVVGPGNSRRWVPVTTGVFDDGSGLVQVTGALSPGQRVVVPAS